MIITQLFLPFLDQLVALLMVYGREPSVFPLRDPTVLTLTLLKSSNDENCLLCKLKIF